MQLVHEIMGEKYVLVEIPFIVGSRKQPADLIKKYNMLYQGVKEINRSTWGKAVVVQTFFIKEEDYLEFGKEMNDTE